MFQLLFIFLAFSSGIIISAGVFAFIATIGLVPRLAQKTRTEGRIKLYESSIIAGGIFGAATMCIDFYIPIGKLAVMLIFLCIGIFVGCMAVSLAEVLDVIPILSRKSKIFKGIPYLILSVALGKLIGSLIYYIIPGFYYK